MYPVVFQWGWLTIFTYGCFLALGFLLATMAFADLGKKSGFQKDDLMDFTIWILVASIVGARILYILINLPHYQEHPLEIILLNRGGLVFYGGILGGILAGICYLKKKKLPVLKIGDMAMTVIPLGQMFGRIGCFLNGCCFGRPTTFPIKVTFPLGSPACDYYQELMPVHPVQLYESIALGCFFLLLLTIYEKKRFDGQMIALYGMGYAVIRFLLEFLRGDNPPILAGLTLSQCVGIVVFPLSLGLYFYWSKKKIQE
ncbi:MAG: prolipoprotein diacylglyceryl transferase [Candidatus Aureabacteria bacterium]|nr:prolipoprotein diacylglyceryl transferase [Candidatus Auribacterota bacterium]